MGRREDGADRDEDRFCGCPGSRRIYRVFTVTIEGHVVVAGGASGLGLAIAERLLDEGAAVSVLDADAVAVVECTDRFAGEDILFLECDVSDEEEVAEAVAQAVAGMGAVSGLVNCAGIRRTASFERTSAELFRQLLEVNLTGSFITCQAALDEMADRLSIVNIASTAGIRAKPGQSAYGASKAGLVMMSRVMACELAGSGVRVNIVAAGPQEGEAEVDEDGLTRPRHAGREHMVSAGDIASAVLFLLSDAAAAINGHVLVVDGGDLVEAPGPT